MKRRPNDLRPARPHERFPEYVAVLREVNPGQFVVVSFNRMSIPAGYQINLAVKQVLYSNLHDLH